MTKKRNPTQQNFVFRKHASIGAADAIDDAKFLSESFIDTGELSILTDMSRPECIILGRTGSGKTALIERIIKTEERVIKIEPDSLAITYVSNSDILGFFVKAGVNMDLFYRLLWRHVFAIEIIKKRYHITNEDNRNGFLADLDKRLRGKKPQQDAINYLREWGESFWKETDYRVKEITQKLEKDLTTSVEGSIKAGIPKVGSGEAKLSAESAKRLTEETRADVVKHGQQVVDQVQVKTLSEIVKLLDDEILNDSQKKYFVTIDRLDEDWVNDDLRYRLIRALVETVRDFNNNIRNVKIIIAVREDLMDRVFRYTRSPGYQEEKYHSMYLTLIWKPADLKELLDRRVNQLIKEQYTSYSVKLSDLLPAKVHKKDDGVNYLIERTLLRPRDAIAFFNECLSTAEGKAKINQTMLLSAEAKYSERRLKALADEWSADYPNLIELILFLKRYPINVNLDVIANKIEESMLQFLVENEQLPSDKRDRIYYLIEEKFYSGDIKTFIEEMLKILYKVGVVGIKQESFSETSWSFMGHKLVGSDLSKATAFYIHAAFWRVLGINSEQKTP